ncbi:MAG: response regulator [Candidatus Latescibacterota bacterium]|nr:response regulator [Candidatus Latescibacterota bacterium]
MRVLIVDDDPDVRSSLYDGIKTVGAEVIHTAESGEEALAKAIQMRYDLVTLDIKMSGASGIDILSVIRWMMPCSVIAIVSGYTEEVSEMALDHTDLVLAKPGRVDILQKLVTLTGELVEKREALRGLDDTQN